MSLTRNITLPPTLNPERFTFWSPEEQRMLSVGADQAEMPLPELILPINNADLEEGDPEDAAIGQGVYDYLRQFPDCPHNTAYANLLQEAFPHYLTDLAAQAVLLDAKDVETTHVRRKLTGLKILALVEPQNAGLLLQLCRGYYELALSYEELSECRRHLLQAMRFGQELIKVASDDAYGLHLLAEIDVLLGDFPGADMKWHRALESAAEESFKERIAARIQFYSGRPWVETTLIDNLEAVHKAMELYAADNFSLALAILDRIEEEGRFAEEMPSAEYFYLLGMCRQKNGEEKGAIKALERSLALNDQYDPARQALDALMNGAACDV